VDAANAQLLRHLLLKQHFQSCEAVQAVSGMMAQIAFKEFGGDSTCKWVTVSSCLNTQLNQLFCNIKFLRIFD